MKKKKNQEQISLELVYITSYLEHFFFFFFAKSVAALMLQVKGYLRWVIMLKIAKLSQKGVRPESILFTQALLLTKGISAHNIIMTWY